MSYEYYLNGIRPIQPQIQRGHAERYIEEVVSIDRHPFDIHGNYAALSAVLDELDDADVRTVVCLGDTAGYYTQINECCDALRSRGVFSLMGNHDYYLTSGEACPRSDSATRCYPVPGRHHRTDAPCLARIALERGGNPWTQPRAPRLERPARRIHDTVGALLRAPRREVLLFRPHTSSEFGGRTESSSTAIEVPLASRDEGSTGRIRHLGRILVRTASRNVEYDVEATQRSMTEAGFDPYFSENLAYGLPIRARADRKSTTNGHRGEPDSSAREATNTMNLRERILARPIVYRTFKKIVLPGGVLEALVAIVRFYHVDDGGHVLDLGCGFGDYAPFFAGRCVYVGIDHNADYVATARRLNASVPATFLVADVTDPVVKESMARTTSSVPSGVLHHLEDDVVEQLALNVAPLLKPANVSLHARTGFDPEQGLSARLLIASDRGRLVRDAAGYQARLAVALNQVAR